MPGSHFHKSLPDDELHRPAIISETDPGAVGAGIAWYRPSTRVMSIRSAANDGWEAISAQAAQHGNEAHDPDFASDADLTTHVGDTTNPHEVSAAQAGADPAGSASAVQDNLTSHEALTTDAHGGIVADDDARLSDARTPLEHGNEAHNPDFATEAALAAHEGDTGNPHSVTAVQAGADPAGSAAAVQTNLDDHEGDTDDPHGTKSFLFGLEQVKGLVHRIAGYVADALERELDEISAGYGAGRRVGVNAEAYTVANDTPDRSLDPTGYTDAEVEDLAHIVATLIRDLGRDE